MFTLRDVKTYLHARLQRILLMIARGVITNVEGERVQVYLKKGELIDGVEIFSQFGFHANPKPGAEAVTVFVGGSQDHGIVIATRDKRYKMTLLPGEVAIQGTEGQYVKCKQGGEIEAVGKKVKVNATEEVDITAPTANINAANVNITGATGVNIAAGAATVNAGTVLLGSGASRGVARINDTTQHNCPYTGGVINGNITSASGVAKSL